MPGTQVRVGVIAAAGKGTRAYPRTSFIPKPLFRFDGRTLLERNAEMLFRDFGVRRLYVLVGHLREQVVEEVERIRARYRDREIEPALWTQKGLASDVASLRSQIHEDFVLVLGDEFYHNTDPKKLVSTWKARKNAAALIAVWKSDLVSYIRKNYSVEMKGQRVERLIEKPQDPPNNLVGLGTYLFTPDFFDFFDRTEPSPRSGVVELTDVIDHIARDTGRVFAQEIGGRYFNINSLADYYAVNYFLRTESFSKYRISLVIPTRNNAATLPDVISDFQKSVHEVVVVDMGSSDDTVSLAQKARVRVVTLRDEAPHSDGRAVYEGLLRATGDILVVAPPDGSFRAHDLPKLLEYLKDCDLAVGTRTTRQMIEQGANLRPAYRWLNVFFGKFVEILWWDQEPRYTDIGCAYRAIWKDSFEKISGELRARDRTYCLEMMIETMRFHMRCIEVPVSYYQRYGQSPEETLSSRWRYFFSVLGLILSRRFPSLGRIGRRLSASG